MRWLIDSDNFERVPLAQYAPGAFWLVAILFAIEHGSYWDVGLATGIVYNWWMVRTRNVWDSSSPMPSPTPPSPRTWSLRDNGSTGSDLALKSE